MLALHNAVGGDLIKIHQKAQPPYEDTPFHYSLQLILPSLSFAKIPSNFHKKSQITSPLPLLVVDLWKHPLFPRFNNDNAGTAGQKSP